MDPHLDDASGVEATGLIPRYAFRAAHKIVESLAPFYFALQEMAIESHGMDDLAEEINVPGFD